MAAYEHRLTLALLQIRDDAEAILLHCWQLRKGKMNFDEFIAAVEEIANKISQRVSETTL